jgi:DNA excision repair protein ERCC-2
LLRHEIAIGVKELLDILFHPTDLGNGYTSASRAQDGIEGHRLIRDRRPVEYQTEVPIEHIFEWKNYRLTTRGRIDGIHIHNHRMIAEEIKTTYAPLSEVVPESQPIHLAQLQLYLYFLQIQNPDMQICGELTYLNRGR